MERKQIGSFGEKIQGIFNKINSTDTFASLISRIFHSKIELIKKHDFTKTLKTYRFSFERLTKNSTTTKSTKNTTITVKKPKQNKSMTKTYEIILKNNNDAKDILKINLQHANLGQQQIETLLQTNKYTLQEIQLIKEALQETSNNVSHIDSKNKKAIMDINFLKYLKSSALDDKTKNTILTFFLIETLLKIPELPVPKKMISYLRQNAEFENKYIDLKKEYFKENSQR